MAALLVVAPAPVIPRDDGLELDVKFVEGMRFYRERWDGPIGCLLSEGAPSIPFGRVYAREELPFALRVLGRGARPGPADLEGHDAVFGSADSHETLHLPDLCRATGRRCVLAIEYTLGTRLDILRLERRSLPRKARSALWTLATERRRRAAMRAADGLQANGYPAWAAYGGLNANRMLYLDNRLHEALFATEAEMRAREERLLSGAPLRLISSGRLETMKGAQDLVPLARELARLGVAFELDVYGTGSLEETIRAGIARHGLGDRVRLNPPVDFETALVPRAREGADVFLSCHRQSDPSCSYVESMGCGLAVAGYDNAMLSALVAESGAGWCAPLGRPERLAGLLARLDADRAGIAGRCRAALAFSRRHGFHREFARRIDHLRETLGHA
jgi:glycosyltransferase involved in cell wall biosynthesis